MGALAISALIAGGIVLLFLRIPHERVPQEQILQLPPNISIFNYVWISDHTIAYEQKIPGGVVNYPIYSYDTNNHQQATISDKEFPHVASKLSSASDINHAMTLFGYVLGSALSKGPTRLVSIPVGGHDISPPLPTDRYLIDYGLSPRKDRVAWLTKYSHPTPLTAFLHRIFPFYKVKTQTSLELWMSCPDGSLLEKEGTLSPDVPPGYTDGAYWLEWLPDGKRLSFLKKDTLWIVSAEPGR